MKQRSTLKVCDMLFGVGVLNELYFVLGVFGTFFEASMS